jgi:hypothetical protein
MITHRATGPHTGRNATTQSYPGQVRRAAISDYEKTNASPPIQAPAPPPTTADRYTPMAAIEMTDDDLARSRNYDNESIDLKAKMDQGKPQSSQVNY